MKSLFLISALLFIIDFSCHKDRNFQPKQSQTYYTVDYRDTILGTYYGAGTWTTNGVSKAFSDSIIILPKDNDSIQVKSISDTAIFITYNFPGYLKDKSDYTLNYSNKSGNYRCNMRVHFKDPHCDIYLDRNFTLPGNISHRTLSIYKVHR